MKKLSEDDIYDLPERPRKNLGVWQFTDVYRQNPKDTASITGPQWRITLCFIKLLCDLVTSNLEKLREREVSQGAFILKHALRHVAGGSVISVDIMHMGPGKAKLLFCLSD